MVKYNKDNDIQLYNFFEELKKAIKDTKTIDFYLSACDIIKYVIEIGAIHAGIKLDKKGLWFFKRALNLSDYLANKEVKQYLNVIGVNVYSCNSIKDSCDKADKSGNKEFNLEQITNDANFVIDLVVKIYSDIYGDTAPGKDSFKDVVETIDLQQSKLVKTIKKAESNVNEGTITKGETTIVVKEKKVQELKNSHVNDGYISTDDQLDATPRLPVCICLDFSASMKGAKFEKMKDGLEMFCNAILDDPKAKRSAEISIITFNNEFRVYRKFGRLDKPVVLTGITPKNGTCVSPAINCALDMLERRKDEYRRLGMEYYQPWLVFISDGLPGDKCGEVQKRVLELEQNKKLVVLSLPILSAKDDVEKNNRTMAFMDGFSASKSLPLDSEKIKEFFVWLSRSIHVSVRKGRADFSTATSDFKAGLK